MQCLSGEVPPPFAANCLYEALYDSVDYLVQRQLYADGHRAGVTEPNGQDGSRQEPAILGRGDSAKKKKKKTITPPKDGR